MAAADSFLLHRPGVAAVVAGSKSSIADNSHSKLGKQPRPQHRKRVCCLGPLLMDSVATLIVVLTAMIMAAVPPAPVFPP